MKKFLFVIFIFLSFSIFAQKAIEEINGYDWVSYNDYEKVGIARGWLLSNVMMMYMLYETKSPNMSEQDTKAFIQSLENQFYYNESTVDIVNKIDNFYSSPSNRKYTLYRAISYLCGKEWWNRKTGEVETPQVRPNS